MKRAVAGRTEIMAGGGGKGNLMFCSQPFHISSSVTLATSVVFCRPVSFRIGETYSRAKHARFVVLSTSLIKKLPLFESIQLTEPVVYR